jgi:hypothetical protein
MTGDSAPPAPHPVASRTATDPDLHLIVAGTRIDPELRDDSFVFRLPLPGTDMRLMSRASRPSEIGTGADGRMLGVAVRAMTLLGDGRRQPIPLDHPALSNGFHDLEPSGLRWTDGAAVLPARLFAGPLDAGPLDAGPAGPLELHLSVLALPTYRVASVEHAALFARFESLGDNCEFGLVQRAYDIEPLSLFRWSGTDAARLVLGLCRRFEGLGDPAFTRLEWRGEPPDYHLADRRYLSVHTWVGERQTDPAREAEMFAAGCARLRLLRRKLLADIEAGRRIFVFKASGPDARTESFHAVHAALRGIGPAPLLCVTRAATPAQVGQVDRLGDGLYLGHIDQFSRATISLATWRRLCAATAALVDADASTG